MPGGGGQLDKADIRLGGRNFLKVRQIYKKLKKKWQSRSAHPWVSHTAGWRATYCSASAARLSGRARLLQQALPVTVASATNWAAGTGVVGWGGSECATPGGGRALHLVRFWWFERRHPRRLIEILERSPHPNPPILHQSPPGGGQDAPNTKTGESLISRFPSFLTFAPRSWHRFTNILTTFRNALEMRRPRPLAQDNLGGRLIQGPPKSPFLFPLAEPSEFEKEACPPTPYCPRPQTWAERRPVPEPRLRKRGVQPGPRPPLAVLGRRGRGGGGRHRGPVHLHRAGGGREALEGRRLGPPLVMVPGH